MGSGTGTDRWHYSELLGGADALIGNVWTDWMILLTNALVAQRIEHRPPEPVAQVRVLPGALPKDPALTTRTSSPVIKWVVFSTIRLVRSSR